MLRLLIDDLNNLWFVVVETYDAFIEDNFQLRSAMMWTISYFQAYGMLSGWSTFCMENIKAIRLKKGWKTIIFIVIDDPYQ